VADRGILSSLRYLFADLTGDDDDTPPFLPEGLPEPVMAVASDAIHLLIDYQGPGYARLYVDRLRRFIGKQGVGDAMLADIARLMAVRMSYQDPIRIAQLKLNELAGRSGAPDGSVDVKKFCIEELIGALPAVVAEHLLDGLDWASWSHKRVSVRFSTASRFGIRRLKIEAGLRRWRLFSVRYARERIWVERWLHMIDRSLARQPPAAPVIIQTASMIEGYGDVYRRGMADWNAIIDSLVKPTFDGALALSDLGNAVTEARAAAFPDSRQAALKRKIAEIRARVVASSYASVSPN
jgi:hypothetical protein